jgi:molybdopterin-containing oxidoreductase family membrane subunit
MSLLEHPFTGTRRYWTWVAALVAIIAIGVAAWLNQLHSGLAVTGLGRDVSWGLYIAQFTFLVGVAASAVMVVLPYYLHDRKAFACITILGELLAIASVVACALFIFVDMGQPSRVLNVLRYAAPSSLMFWDMLSLGGYLVINAVLAWTTLSAERNDVPAPGWIKPLVLLSIPWAISIHTVTAFLYAGLPGRSFWMTGLLAPRFLASAFAAGPSLLILLALLLRRVARFDVGRDAIGQLSVIVTYAMVTSLFFVLMEMFTVFYSRIPEHVQHIQYLFSGLDGHRSFVPWMWASAALALASLVLLIVPRFRRDDRLLALACGAVFVSLWIDKGLGLIVAGFVPTPLETVVDYAPTPIEIAISAGIWAVGALLVTVLFKIVMAVRTERGAAQLRTF